MARPWKERDEMAERLRRLLIEAREAAGLNQTDLAKRFGRSQSLVSNYERGQRRIDVAEFVIICRALKLDAHEMLELVQSNSVPTRR
jgi:transcriptional regulator with XRE-family HTH domain